MTRSNENSKFGSISFSHRFQREKIRTGTLLELGPAAHGESVMAICFILSVLHTQDPAVDMNVFLHHLVQTVPLKLNSRPTLKKKMIDMATDRRFQAM